MLAPHCLRPVVGSLLLLLLLQLTTKTTTAFESRQHVAIPRSTTAFSVGALKGGGESLSSPLEPEDGVTDASASATTDAAANSKILPLTEACGRGIVRDFAARWPDYRSDFVDGINAPSLATTLFLFFACLAPAIGFGGILGQATAGAMGAMEMVLSTSLCGVVYALLAPQPVQLIGPMGPNLAFTLSLLPLAKLWQVPFLPLYAWTGLWTAGFLGLAALFSLSHVVQYLTRFTDEIFSVLISTIFLVGAVQDVARPFFEAGSTSTAAATALATLTCAALTFGSATLFKSAKASPYGTPAVRNQVSNFAPALGVACGATVAQWLQRQFPNAIVLPVLELPATLSTTTGRPWRVPLAQLPVWARWAAAGPALLAAVLLFLDQNITARLVNHPRYRQTKGKRQTVLDGMHGDMAVLSGLTAVTSLCGLPWMAGATTRSAAHVRSLSLVNATTGEITGVLENRVSGAAIHALIGICAAAARPRAILAAVPRPVLSGVFLYLGRTSLQGLALWDRILGLFQQQQLPQYAAAKVSRRTTTFLTLLQMTCVAALMRVTQSSVGVLAPLLIALLPLLRWILLRTHLVSRSDMEVLDD